MDVSTFYALFSAACFTLVGLWWGVIQRDLGWATDLARRRAVAGVYLAFLLPALMGLFAQVGGVQTPAVWRVSFVVIALVGCLTTARLLSQEDDRAVAAVRAGAVAVYAMVALLGAFPGIAGAFGLQAIQAEALLLVLLVALGHALVWRFLVQGALTRA
jgi:cellobiose-specific phosphotransferase system component IIC